MSSAIGRLAASVKGRPAAPPPLPEHVRVAIAGGRDLRRFDVVSYVAEPVCERVPVAA